MSDCGWCSRETAEVLCARCVRLADTLLGDILDLAGHLEDAIIRQTRAGARSSGHRTKGDEVPMPYADSPKITAAAEVIGVLAEWADHATGQAPSTTRKVAAGPTAGRRHEATAALAVRLLRSDLAWFRVNPAAPVCVEALHVARNQLRSAVDRPPSRIYAGTCSAIVDRFSVTTTDEQAEVITPTLERVTCGAALHVQVGDVRLKCRACGATYTPAQRALRELIDFCHGMLPLDEILAALPRLAGYELDPALVRQWRRRRRLIACVENIGGKPVETFRCADVMHLAEQSRRPPATDEATRAKVRERVRRHRTRSDTNA